MYISKLFPLEHVESIESRLLSAALCADFLFRVQPFIIYTTLIPRTSIPKTGPGTALCTIPQRIIMMATVFEWFRFSRNPLLHALYFPSFTAFKNVFAGLKAGTG